MGDPARPPFDCVVRAWVAHERELLAFLQRRSSDPDAAEDLLQEVFLKAMRQGEGFCTLDNPRAWLFQVARHALIDAARLAKPQVELPDDLVAPTDEEHPPVDALDACIQRQLPTLADEDRDILQACDLHGQTVRAYAEARGLTLPASKSRLLRARQRLRERLVQACQVRFDAQGRVCCHQADGGCG